MKKTGLILIIVMFITVLLACNKAENRSERFNFLTGQTWVSDSLLIGGVDASGPGQMLEKFIGDARFYEDGSGYFGQYTGKWFFLNHESDITITSDSLALPLTADILELTASSFKISTQFTAAQDVVLEIRITFEAK